MARAIDWAKASRCTRAHGPSIQRFIWARPCPPPPTLPPSPLFTPLFVDVHDYFKTSNGACVDTCIEPRRQINSPNNVAVQVASGAYGDDNTPISSQIKNPTTSPISNHLVSVKVDRWSQAQTNGWVPRWRHWPQSLTKRQSTKWWAAFCNPSPRCPRAEPTNSSNVLRGPVHRLARLFELSI